MIRRLHDRLGAGERRIRIDQISRRVDDAAHLAGIGILVFRVTVRALALDVAVGEEHPLDGVVELLDRLLVDQAGRLQPPIDVLRQLGVLRRVGGVPVIEGDVEAVEILRPIGRDPRRRAAEA